MKIKEIEYAISRDLVNYPESVKIMEKRIENISSKKKSELIWFLEHPSIYKAGTSADKKDLLKKNIFPVFKYLYNVRLKRKKLRHKKFC